MGIEVLGQTPEFVADQIAKLVSKSESSNPLSEKDRGRPDELINDNESPTPKDPVKKH